MGLISIYSRRRAWWNSITWSFWTFSQWLNHLLQIWASSSWLVYIYFPGKLLCTVGCSYSSSFFQCFELDLVLWIILQVIERILLSPKKTGLHDDVLQILFLHIDPMLPLPRIRMLSVRPCCLKTFQTIPLILWLLMLLMLCFSGSLPCSRCCPCLPIVYWPSIEWIVPWSTSWWSSSRTAPLLFLILAIYITNMSGSLYFVFSLYRLCLVFMPKIFMSEWPA